MLYVSHCLDCLPTIAINTAPPITCPTGISDCMPGTGIEPVRGCPRGIFLPATAFAAARVSAHLGSGLYLCPVMRLEHQLMMRPNTLELGRGRQVSTLSRARARA